MGVSDASVKRYAKFLLVSAGIGGILCGIDIKVISAALPYLQNGIFSDAQCSMILAAVQYGSMAASLMGGFLAELLGRKRMISICSLLFLIAVPIVAFSTGSFWALLCSRIMQGVSIGILCVVIPMYLAESLDANSRGKGTGIFQLLLSLGLVVASAFGTLIAFKIGAADDQTLSMANRLLAWRLNFFGMIVPGALLFTASFMLKESPRWLFRKGRRDEALASLMANNTRESALKILDAMAETDKKSTPANASNKVAAGDGSIFKRKYVIPFAMALLVLCLTKATGVNSMLGYAVNTFQKSGMAGESANIADILCTVANLMMTIFAASFVDKAGRTFLMKVGSAGMIVCLLGIAGTFFAISNYGVAPSFFTGLLISAFFILFMCFYGMGPGVCVWLALSELMPNRVRAQGMSIALFGNQFVSMAIASSFLPAVNAFGYGWVFVAFAVFTICYFLVACWMPETKGRTLEEIEEYFATGSMPVRK